MSWFAITKEGKLLTEEEGGRLAAEDQSKGYGRPVEAGNTGGLLVMGEEVYGHKVAVDLLNGMIAIDYQSIGVQNGTIELDNPKMLFSVCEETSIVGEYRHLKQTFSPVRGEDGKYKKDAQGRRVKSRTDELEPLLWRAISFMRHISNLPAPIHVIGCQVTTPEIQGAKNIKCLVSLFPDGRIGISG